MGFVKKRWGRHFIIALLQVAQGIVSMSPLGVWFDLWTFTNVSAA